MTRFARVRFRRFQTAEYVFRHRETGKKVTLIGTLHSAKPEYFQGLLADIAARQEAGAEVQYELVRDAGEAAWATATDEERQALESLESLKFVTQALQDSLGLVYQTEGLPLDDSWTNVDMTDLELIRALGPDYFIENGITLTSFFGDADPEVMKDVGPLMLRFVAMPGAQAFAARADRKAGRPDSSEVILRQRNELALSKALAPGTGDVVLIWGAAHLEGLAAALKTEGFKHVSTKWNSAVRLPGLSSALRGLAGFLRLALAVSEKEQAAKKAEEVSLWPGSSWRTSSARARRTSASSVSMRPTTLAVSAPLRSAYSAAGTPGSSRSSRTTAPSSPARTARRTLTTCSRTAPTCWTGCSRSWPGTPCMSGTAGS
jgi:hypothetical protein